MTKPCVVPQCKTGLKSLKIKRSVFKVPSNSERLKKWNNAIPSRQLTPSHYVCEKHFEEKYIVRKYIKHDANGKVIAEYTYKHPRLTESAIPTLFDESIRVEGSTGPTIAHLQNVAREELSVSMDVDVAIHSDVPLDTPAEGTMKEDAKETTPVKEEMSLECRACLQIFNSDSELYYIFQAWVPPWEEIDNTIAESLEKLAQIQVSDMDQHSKVICEACCEKLHSAYLFMEQVQQSDHILKQRYDSASAESRTSSANRILDTRWPKPIQVDRIVPVEGTADFEIKQEVLTDEEIDYPTENDTQTQLAEMEIKVEPEEILPQQNSHILNGHYGQLGSGDTTPDLPTLNGEESSQDNCSMTIKEEPLSDSELAGTDLSLDCMLCTKVFNSVTGLKAHVIAQHSYKSVRRKAAHEMSPVKKNKNAHVCATCRRSFTTSTDLMVHETCHKKSVCYGCNAKFDTFELVTQHRLTCKAVIKREQAPIKTLEDVQRPAPAAVNDKENRQDLLKCAHCDETFTDNYYMNIHLEVQHPGPRPALSEEEMEVDALESLFSERA